MATVKRREPGQVQKRAVPFVPQQGGNTPSDVGTSAIQTGQELMAVGNENFKVSLAQIQDHQERKDKAHAKDAYVLFGDSVRSMQVELESLEKRDAEGSTVQAQKKVDEMLEKMSGQLQNDRQRELFESLAFTRRSSFLDKQSGYERDQIKRWESESSNAMADEAIQYATENYSQPGAVDDAVNKVEIAVVTAMGGSSAEAVERVVAIKTSKLHEAVINNMAVSSASQAKKYYAKHKEDIDGTMQTNIESMLKSVGVKQTSQTKADEITRSGKSYEDQLEIARKIKDPEVRDATVSRIKIRDQELKTFEAETRQRNKDQTTSDIIAFYREGGSLEAAIDLATAQVVNGADQAALISMTRALYSGPSKTTNSKKRLEAMSRIDDPKSSIDQIKSKDQLYTDYAPYLSDTDYKALEKYWEEGGATGGLKNSRVLTTYKSMVKYDPKKSKDRDKFSIVWDYVDSNLPKDKKPTDSEIRTLISRAVMEGERKGGGYGYGADTNYADAVQKGHGSTWLPDMDDRQRSKAKKWLEKEGDAVNDFNLRFYWRVVEMGISSTPELNELYRQNNPKPVSRISRHKIEDNE